ncbi:phage-related protein [Mucilaginibacter sp. UYNi724]
MRRLVFLVLIVLLYSCKKSDLQAPESPAISTETGGSNTGNGKPTGNESPSNTWPKALVALPKRVAFGTNGDYTQSANYIKESDYQYQYLADDIFTGGWASWNSPTGEFAKKFLEKTDNMGKIPVFTYYNIVPAKNRYQDPAFANLNDSEVMNKYLADWKLLLQICNKFGKTVIIHYEPDLFGYMQFYKKDPIKSIIKVSQSDYPDAKPFTNDLKGLAQTIVSMRDKYAPNVLLAWHASQWAAGLGLILNKPNPEQMATETANYYESLQAPFDLIFSEFSDCDSGYDQFVNNKLNTAWWSTTQVPANNDMNDFDRFQRFLKKLNQQTGQKIILWQIPVGNTATATCNNKSGHYKDNKAEYFLQPVLSNGNMGNIKAYGEAGVIAFLFGNGLNNCTSYLDSKRDGITGAGEAADDDGGYLRKAVGAYYRQGALAIQ